MDQTFIRARVAVPAAFIAALASLGLAASASAQSTNPWLENRFLNWAHQGGELEAPSNTMYALKSAVRERGADGLEIDVNATSDGELVVIHDVTVTRTTDDTGRVENKTAAQIRAMDAAYWYVPGENTPHSGHAPEDYVFRGVRNGDVPPPPGYTADDFAHPTLEEVLDEFPDVPINIEIKGDNDEDREEIATLLAEVLTSQPYASRQDIIVVSFDQTPLDKFHSLAPSVDLAASEDALLPWALGGGNTQLPEGTVALQVPPRYELGGTTIDVAQLMLDPNGIDAHGKGYAVHIWTDGEGDETPQMYQQLLNYGVDGIMTQAPGRLHEFLCAADVPRPGGATGRCQVSASLELPRQTLKQARKRGIRATAGCSGPCSLALRATVTKKAAKRAGIWPKKGRGSELELGSATLEPGSSYRESAAAIPIRKKLARKLRGLRGKLPVQVAATADWAGSQPVVVERSAKLKGKKRKRRR